MKHEARTAWSPAASEVSTYVLCIRRPRMAIVQRVTTRSVPFLGRIKTTRHKIKKTLRLWAFQGAMIRSTYFSSSVGKCSDTPWKPTMCGCFRFFTAMKRTKTWMPKKIHVQKTTCGEANLKILQPASCRDSARTDFDLQKSFSQDLWQSLALGNILLADTHSVSEKWFIISTWKAGEFLMAVVTDLLDLFNYDLVSAVVCLVDGSKGPFIDPHMVLPRQQHDGKIRSDTFSCPQTCNTLFTFERWWVHSCMKAHVTSHKSLKLSCIAKKKGSCHYTGARENKKMDEA